MITMRVAVMIDRSVLREVIDAARRAGTSFQIEPFYRVRHETATGVPWIDCDTVAELLHVGETVFPSVAPLPTSHVPVPADTVDPPVDDPGTPSTHAHVNETGEIP